MGDRCDWAIFESMGYLRIRTGHDLSLRMAIVWVPFEIGYFEIQSDFIQKQKTIPQLIFPNLRIRNSVLTKSLPTFVNLTLNDFSR